MQLSITLAQLNATVGDIEGNVQKIIHAYEQAVADNADLLVCPELMICGYPPEDLLLRPSFRQACMDAVRMLESLTENQETALVVGGVWDEEGRSHNTAFLIEHGKVVHKHYKTMLPNYGVFDEKRVFVNGRGLETIHWRGHKLALMVCEDIWRMRMPGSIKEAELAIVINASPYEVGKQAVRHQVVRDFVKFADASVVYVNMIGAQDDLVFDGQSFVMDVNGKVIGQISSFEACVVGTRKLAAPAVLMREEKIWRACGLGLKEYVEKNNFPGVILGLSGGIDSAVVAAMAVDVLGAEHVVGVRLPSHLTSDASNDDAEALASNLGIRLITVPISPAYAGMDSMLSPAIDLLNPVMKDWRENLTVGGNMQSRLRGVTLMALSNASGYMLLNTSNKSEIAVGYSTLYGDSCGGYSPLKDVYKSDVFKLAEWRNQEMLVIPESIIAKPPTAELVVGQKDSDELPEYAQLDALLLLLVEGQASIHEAVEQSGQPHEVVEKIARLLRISEYKRRQAPPGPKVTPMQFTRDRRYPLTNQWKG